MTVQSPSVRSIFEQAAEITSEADRRAFLDEAFAAHPEVRQQVEALLKAHANVGSFLDQPAFEAQPTTPHVLIAEGPGAVIGPYKLLQQIGEGGMGVVFMAEQTHPVQRTVALKIIKPGMDTRQVIARFEAERQALALMDHPNIAKVLDAGTTAEPGTRRGDGETGRGGEPDAEASPRVSPSPPLPLSPSLSTGRPYFVMDLVKGVPITDYCDQQHLTIRQRLEQFTQVCHAVQHAHQKGIIHRDLKPSNVLVAEYDGKPVPKVIDFGVAKATAQRLTERTMFTQYGQIVGTFEYMSPEQARFNQLDVDTRSDIYSLGVLLYELLAGSTPLEKERLRNAAFDEILRIISEEDPPRPSTRLSSSEALPSIAANRHSEPARLNKDVSGELDWIVMKCLEKDRNRRYETANSLAIDIQRHLNDEQVLACPPSAAYRLRKFIRRNKAGVLAGTAIALALIVGTIVSTWQAIRATRAEKLAAARLITETEARREADQQRAQAESNFQKAKAAVDEYFTLVSESKLFDVPGLQPLRKELLDAALRFYKSSAVERSDDPAVLAELAVTYMRVSEISHTVDRNDDAIVAMDQALAVIDRLRRDFPQARDEHRRLAGYWKGYRPASIGTDTPRDSAAALRTLSRFVETWDELSREYPNEPAFRADLAGMCYHTGQLLSSGGQRAERITYWKRGKTALEELLRDDPNNPEYRADLAGVCRDLGESVFVSDEQEGRTLIEGAEQLAEDLTVQFPKVPAYRFQLIRCRSLLAKNDRDRDPAAAESMYRGAMELAEAAVQEYPGYRLAEDLWFDVGQYWVPLATARGKYAEVEGSLRRLIAALEARVQDNPDGYARVQLARICHLTANGFFEQQDMAAVEELERRAAPAYAESARRDPSRPWCWEVAAKCEMRLAEIFEADGRIGEAYDAYRRAGEAADSLARRFPDGRDYVRLFPDHRDCWITWSWTVSAEERFKARHDLESTEVVRRRIETFESQLEENPQDRVARTRLAFACHQLSTRLADDAAGSELFAARAAVLWRELAAEHRADVILECAKVLASISGVEEAEAAIRAASEQDSSDALANNNFAWFLATCETQPLRDPALAVRLAKKAVGLAPKDGNIWNTLGVAQYRAGDWQATIDGLQKAMDLRNGGDSSDWFFLAMAYWQLDRKDEARTWFDKAVEWMDENAPTNEELLRFRAEAGKLLGITEPQSASDEQPDDDAPPTTNN